MKFLDQVKIYVKAGNGGDGSPSFRIEKFIEYGGPDGGDGGKGGSVILKSEQNLNTLIDYRYQQHHKAERGENGMGQNRTGKSGENLILKVPLGTQVFEEDNKTLIYDFIKPDEEYVAASGGKGGLGNTRFKSSTNRAPRKFTKGTSGEEFTIADIPGLIEGAHEGTGLGIQFLKHIERCKTLLHLIDITSNDLEKTYNQVRNELKSYSPSLLKKKELVVLNKIDLIEEAKIKEIVNDLSKKVNKEIFILSTLQNKSVIKIKTKLISYVF